MLYQSTERSSYCRSSTVAVNLHQKQQQYKLRCSLRRLNPTRTGAAPFYQPVSYIAMANIQPPVLQRPIALLFGDSLTERSFDPDGGWGAALAHHYARKLDVINRGFGGYNSRWGLKLLPQILKQVTDQGQKVTLMTIWFGANDSAVPGRSADRQHVPVSDFTTNLDQMITMSRSSGISEIILITPPPVGDLARIKHQQMRMGITDPVTPDRTLEYSQQYAAAVCDIAAKHNLPVVDLYNRLQQASDDWREEYLIDGLHFSPAGARQVWLELKQVLEQQYPDLSVDQMSNQMPWWDQWDHKDPDAYWDNALQDMQERQAAAAAVADMRTAT